MDDPVELPDVTKNTEFRNIFRNNNYKDVTQALLCHTFCDHLQQQRVMYYDDQRRI